MIIRIPPDNKFIMDGWHKLDLCQVRYFVMFIGAVRSGHTLVNQIINSHRDAIMAEELNMFWSMNMISREQLFSQIYQKTLHRKVGVDYKIYKDSYKIGYYQGLTTKPFVIGNKMAGADTTRMSKDNNFERFKKYIGFPVKLIWVKRNPLDQIASKVEMGRHFNNIYKNIQINIDTFLLQMGQAQELSQKNDTLMICLDNLLKDKERQIIRLMDYLTLDTDPQHIKSCMGLMEGRARQHPINLSSGQYDQLIPFIRDYKNAMGETK